MSDAIIVSHSRRRTGLHVTTQTSLAYSQFVTLGAPLALVLGANLGSAIKPRIEAGTQTGSRAAPAISRFNLVIAVMVGVPVIFLMDLQNATILIRIIALAGIFWIVLMFASTFNDYLSRPY